MLRHPAPRTQLDFSFLTAYYHLQQQCCMQRHVLIDSFCVLVDCNMTRYTDCDLDSPWSWSVCTRPSSLPINTQSNPGVQLSEEPLPGDIKLTGTSY
jgi:hypothetical protein